jgi:hypothetical protein
VEEIENGSEKCRPFELVCDGSAHVGFYGVPRSTMLHVDKKVPQSCMDFELVISSFACQLLVPEDIIGRKGSSKALFIFLEDGKSRKRHALFSRPAVLYAPNVSLKGNRMIKH